MAPNVLTGLPLSLSSLVNATKPKDSYPDIVAWAHKKYWIPETGRLIELLPHQRAVLRYFFQRRDNGRLKFSTMVYSTVKKSLKTTIGGVVAAYSAEELDKYATCYCVANDRSQAQERTYKSLRGSYELAPGYDRKNRILPGVVRITDVKATYASGSEVFTVSLDAKGEAGANPVCSIWSEAWGMDCLDEETELLCRSGWKRWDAISYDDEVAALSPTGFLEWQTPSSIHLHNYSGPMLKFTHRRMDMLVTPNHRVFGRFLNNARQRAALPIRKVVRDLKGRDTISGWWHEVAAKAAQFAFGKVKSDADWVGDDIEVFAVPAYKDRPPMLFDAGDWAEFFGWYLAEGSQNGQSVSIYQSSSSNAAKYQQIQELLDRMMLRARPIRDGDGFRGFVISSTQLASYLGGFGNSQDRYIPASMKNWSWRLLQRLFLAYMKGDGWRPNKTHRLDTYQCQTTSRRLADDLMEVGLKLGYIPRFMGTAVRQGNEWLAGGIKPEGYRPQHRVSFSKGEVAWQKNHHHWSEVPYSGKVWCVTVPHGTVYARRTGHCFWTGNSVPARLLWDELTPSPVRTNSFRFVESYAGIDPDSELLLDLYNKTVHEGRQLTAADLAIWSEEEVGVFEEAQGVDDLVPLWVNDESGIVTYWDSGPRARRMPWQQGEEGERYYREQLGTLTDNSFRREHLNEWVGSTSAFVDASWWAACADPHIPPLKSGSATPELVIAVDGAVSGDCCAIIAVSRHPFRPAEVVVRYCRTWTPPVGGKLDYEAPDGLGPELRRLCREYNVLTVVYDPYQLHDLMTQMRKEGWSRFLEFGQGKPRMEADKGLYDLIKGRRVHFNPDPAMGGDVLTQHIHNSASKQGKQEDTKLRLIKKSEKLKIDGSVTLSMGCYECLRLYLDPTGESWAGKPESA